MQERRESISTESKDESEGGAVNVVIQKSGKIIPSHKSRAVENTSNFHKTGGGRVLEGGP